MTQQEKTIAGTWYTLTCTAAATVTQEIDGETATLATLEKSGTTVFRASASTITIETDGKFHILPTKAPAAASVSSGGATQEQIATALHAALYDDEPVTRQTPEGTDNATCNFIELDAQHVPAGRLQSISLRSRNSTNPSTYSHLGIWELEEDGSTWTYLGSSINSPGQAMNTTKTWEFAEGIVLSGRALRILAQPEPSDVWEIGRQLGLRTSPMPEGDTTLVYYNGTEHAFLPQIAIAVQQPVAKFAPVDHVDDATVHVSAEERSSWSSTATSLSSHTDNTVIHITAEDRILLDEAATNFADFSHHTHDTIVHLEYYEREWLDAMRSGSQELAVPALTVNGTGGNNLLVVRGNETNVTVTGSQLSFNVPQLTAMSDVPVLYRYDMSAGASEVWFAGTPDAERLAPMGIVEAGTHVGVPTLPLFLRGSELRWNGSPLDMAGMSELLAHKEELLALLNNGMAQTDDSGASG